MVIKTFTTRAHGALTISTCCSALAVTLRTPLTCRCPGVGHQRNPTSTTTSGLADATSRKASPVGKGGVAGSRIGSIGRGAKHALERWSLNSRQTAWQKKRPRHTNMQKWENLPKDTRPKKLSRNSPKNPTYHSGRNSAGSRRKIISDTYEIYTREFFYHVIFGSHTSIGSTDANSGRWLWRNGNEHIKASSKPPAPAPRAAELEP